MRIPSFLVSLVLLVIATSGVSMASDTWPMSGRNAQATRYNPGEHVITAATAALLHQVWTFPASGPIVLVGSRVYAVSACRVVSVDMQSGRIVRTLFSTAAPSCPTALAYGKGKLFAAAGRSIFAMVANSGRVLWRLNVVAQWLVVNGDRLYTGAGCQNTPDLCGKPISAAIDLLTGHVLWQRAQNFGGQPVLVGDLLYRSVGVFWGESRIYNANTGNLINRVHFLHTHWLSDDQNAYAQVARGPLQGSWLGRIEGAGRAAWKVELGKINPRDAPALAYHILYAPAIRSHPGVVAVDPDTGRTLWFTRLAPDLRLVVANQLVFALETGGGKLDMLDAGDGQIRARVTVPQVPNARPLDLAVGGGKVLILYADGITALSP